MATQDIELRPRDPTHLAGDTLLLRNKDVLLPQSLLQPLRSQHGLASLQSCCNTERDSGDAGDTAKAANGLTPQRPLCDTCPREKQGSISGFCLHKVSNYG